MFFVTEVVDPHDFYGFDSGLKVIMESHLWSIVHKQSGENQSDGNNETSVYIHHLQIAQLPLQEGRIQQRYSSASVQFRLYL